MEINFSYDQKNIDYVSGHVFKGKNYRCSYIRYDSLYRNPAPGTRQVEIYFYEPKKQVRASTLILHGLGSRNIKFLLWLGPHLANAGVSTSILILPGNYTRVEDRSVSGKSYLYPDLDIMYQFWEHGIVDILTTIDLLDQEGFWKKNNIILGYCLGGMLATIIGAIDKRISNLLFMTTGGHIPSILHESPVTKFARRLMQKNIEGEYQLSNKELLYDIYRRDFSQVQEMDLKEILSNPNIHPLLRIDPISYAHLLDMKKVTFIDAYFDSTLPKMSRKILYKEMEGANRKILPISHVNWLPFGYPMAKYILHRLNISDREAKEALLTKESMENPLEK